MAKVVTTTKKVNKEVKTGDLVLKTGEVNPSLVVRRCLAGTSKELEFGKAPVYTYDLYNFNTKILSSRVQAINPFIGEVILTEE